MTAPSSAVTVRVVAATPLVSPPFSVALTDDAQKKSFDASMLPVFWIVICATPPKTPGATFVSVSAALHAGLTLLVAAPFADRQAVVALTWSLIVNVPDAIVSPEFAVSALKDPQVPPPPK